MRVYKLYRFDTYRKGYGGRGLTIREFYVMSETPKGWWINVDGKKTWISKTAKKRYAYPTREEALESFRCRKTAFVKHAQNMLEVAKTDLKIAGTLDYTDPKKYQDFFRVSVIQEYDSDEESIAVTHVDPALGYRKIRREKTYFLKNFGLSLYEVLYEPQLDCSFWHRTHSGLYY